MLKLALVLLTLGLVQAGPAFKDGSVGFMEDIRGYYGSRITGGWEAHEGQFPYQVHIRIVTPVANVVSCGGSLIHHEWVLTSAHCLGNRITYIVRLGSIDVRRPAYVLEYTYRDAVFHPEFDLSQGTRVQQHDIVLLSLGVNIPYGPTIQPIRLQNSKQKDINYDGATLIVSGFGYQEESWNGGIEQDLLRWTYLRGMSNEECLTYFNKVYYSTVCARYYNSTDQSSCYGDSGGPLTIQDEDGKPTQVGIVHYGSWRGCTSVWPTGYVRPGYFLDWMQEVTGINFDWSFS